jgi:hypothetical protein
MIWRWWWWWWNELFLSSSSLGASLDIRSAREGLELGRQCLDVHLVQDVLAEQGHVLHYRK